MASVPLDQLCVPFYNEKTQKEEQLPALHPLRKEEVKFVLYQPPPLAGDDRATIEEWTERLNFLQEDLNWLLTLPHDKFWCQVIFDETLHRSLDSYLRFSPRSYDVVYSLPEQQQQLHNEIHRLVFMVCVRMATYKESKEHYLTPEEFGKIIYENYVFDVPKLMDLSVLYGAGNGPLLTKMITNIFTQQPSYEYDLKAVVPTITQVLHNIAKTCGINIESAPNTPLKLSDPSGGKKVLVAMDTTKFQDLVFYLSDTANTLWAFLDVYPDAARAFKEDDFPLKLSGVYEALFPSLRDSFRERSWTSKEHRDLLKRKVYEAQLCLLKVYRQIVSSCCLQPLLDAKSAEETALYTELYLHWTSDVLGERRFVAHLENLYPFRNDRDILSQSTYTVDEPRLQFIQEAVSEACAIYGKKMQHQQKPKDVVKRSEVDEYLHLEGAAAGGGEYETEDYETLGACARRIDGVELESLVSSVKDLLPDLGEGFIELCLEEMDYSVEKVINIVLEDKLPVSLRDRDRNMARMSRPPDPEERSVLQERKNIYDNDEFDIFTRDDVDLSRVHRGKREEPTDLSILDDKSGIDRLRPLYEKYGSEFADSLYDHEGGDYDDEYDDTYDTNLVGATDVDNADELSAKKLFLIQEDDSEEEDAKRRDLFLEDPAKLRERQAQTRASKEARQKGQGQRSYDVKGGAKGQGQTGDVLKNRASKEKNKSTRVHHNRRALADKKRKF